MLCAILGAADVSPCCLRGLAISWLNRTTLWRVCSEENKRHIFIPIWRCHSLCKYLWRAKVASIYCPCIYWILLFYVLSEMGLQNCSSTIPPNLKSNLLSFSLGACIYWTLAEHADNYRSTYVVSRSWPTHFSNIPINCNQMDRCAMGWLTEESTAVPSELCRSSPYSWDLFFADPWLPWAVAEDSSSAHGCLLHINAPGVGLMSSWDNNTLLHMLITWFPNPCNCQDNNKSFLWDPALCCTLWMCFHSKRHCLGLPFALKCCLVHGGGQGKGSEYIFIMRKRFFFSLPTHSATAELCFLSSC